MRKYFSLFLLYIIRFALSFRYKVTVKGLDKIDLKNPGGVLFLPNHPTVFVDPTLVAMAVWKKYPVRPMVVEYMYYMPVIHSVLKLMNAIPVPDFDNSSNSLKKSKAEHVIKRVTEDLQKGENFLIYPAGRTKLQAKEIVTASGVHKIIQGAPQANVILVKTSGLWGSCFSRALNGKTPNIFRTILWGMKVVLKNLIFFTPKREVTLEFSSAPADFPFKGSRLEMNRYFEKWYNRPDGIKPQEGEEPGESLNLISYSAWKEELPLITPPKKLSEEIDLTKISPEIKEKVLHFLSKVSTQPVEEIKPEMDLANDLGLDSLDIAEVIMFLDDHFEVVGIPVSEMTTVKKVMGLAARIAKFTPNETSDPIDFKNWFDPRDHEAALIQPGETLIESFLNQCDRLGKKAACADAASGVLSYKDAKLRVLLLADQIRTFPGERIGILLPSCVPAYLSVLACQLAGKIPLMINWTVGPRHLESVVEATNVQTILSSWSFLDRLENVDLQGVEEKIVMLEDLRRSFGLVQKIKAFYRSKLRCSTLLRLFNVDKKTKEDIAVLLFTSGTENLPKGVPLSHENILSNQKAAIDSIGIYNDDILLGILPPFHSFGFTVSGLLPLLAGIRAPYFPDPTDGKGVASSMSLWKATLICGAPSFLKSAFKQVSPGKIKTLRYCFTGAEKAPEDLFKLINGLDHCTLLEGYGITECSPIVTVNVAGDPEHGVGKPIKGTKLLIVSLDTHQPLPEGSDGLVLVKGPGVFQGYLNRSQSSPFITVESEKWYNTGDIGRLDETGALILSGRLKRFVKIGGEMISLAAIESTLKKYFEKIFEKEEGSSLAIAAKEEAGEKTKLFLFSTRSVTIDAVNQELKLSGFSNLVKIYKVHEIKEIPLMGSGKINYRAIESIIPSLTETT